MTPAPVRHPLGTVLDVNGILLPVAEHNLGGGISYRSDDADHLAYMAALGTLLGDAQFLSAAPSASNDNIIQVTAPYADYNLRPVNAIIGRSLYNCGDFLVQHKYARIFFQVFIPALVAVLLCLSYAEHIPLEASIFSGIGCLSLSALETLYVAHKVRKLKDIITDLEKMQNDGICNGGPPFLQL